MVLVGALVFVGVFPVLAGAPVRMQHRENWALQTLGPGGPIRFDDLNGDSLMGMGDFVYVSRGHLSLMNFEITGPGFVEQIDPTRPAVSHIDGVEKRFTVIGVDPTTGALELESRANRIMHVWRDYLGLLGLPITFAFHTQNIVVTGQINQGVVFIVQTHAPMVVVFPGASGGAAIIIPRPCNPSPNQDNPCNP